MAFIIMVEKRISTTIRKNKLGSLPLYGEWACVLPQSLGKLVCACECACVRACVRSVGGNTVSASLQTNATL